MKTKENIKRGISLIVLVITIIVIIILAAAVILTVNNNNPMSNANKARYESDRANVQNALSTAVGKISAEKLCAVTIPEQGDIKTGIEYTLRGANDGVIGGKIGWESNATEAPAGYEKTTNLGLKMPKYTQDTIWSTTESGQVIVKVGDVTYGPAEGSGSESAVTTPLTTVVDQDTKFEDTTSNHQIAVIPKGFKVSSVVSEQKIDTGLVVIGPDGSEFVWVPVSNTLLNEVVDSASMTSKLTNWTKGGSLQGTPITSSDEIKEPDLVTDFDNRESYLNQLNSMLGTTFVTGEDFKTYMKQEYKGIYDSIKTNKGFYIGRYETGNLSQETVVSKKGNEDISNQNWYQMYAKQKLYNTKLIGTNVKSNMIYGFQWDICMKWFQSDIVTDATKRGTWSIEKLPTGTNTAYREKNIYDMAGNINDSTVEVFAIDARSTRGASIGNEEADAYAAYRGPIVPYFSLSVNGSRLALYI